MNNVLKDLYTSLKMEKSVFNFLNDEDVHILSTFFKSEHIPVGEALWKEEDPFNYIAFIISGRVKIMKQTEFEGKELLVGIYSRGALCILDDSIRTVTAVALEDVTLAIITQENLDKLIVTNPAVGAKLLKGMLLTVSSRLRQSFDRLAVFF